MTLPSISVVIPTCNSERVLPSCLESIKNQDYPKNKIEIIVVDRFSTDNTPKIARKFGVKLIATKDGRSVARNLGVKASTGKYVLFTDSDMVLSPNVIKESAKKMETDKRIVGLNIPERIVGKGLWAKVRDFERGFYNNTVIDAVRFLKKDTFLEAGSFDEKLYAGEDWDLHKRVQSLGKIDIVKSCVYHKEQNVNLTKYLMKKYYYTKNLNEAYIKKWERDNSVKKQFNIYYRLLGVFIENGKWKKFISKPHLASAVIGLRCLVGGVFLVAKIKSVFERM